MWSKLCCGGVLAFTLGAHAAQEVPLTLHERSGVAREEGVTSGIPLLPGFLRKGEPVVLRGAQGEELPVATTPLAVWPDGSVKWLLLDFPLRTEPGATPTLRLARGEPAALATQLVLDETPERFLVRTGAVEVEINRRELTLFERVALPGAAEPLATGGSSQVEVETTPPGLPEAENWLRRAAGGPREVYHAVIITSRVEFHNAQRLGLLLEGEYRDAEGKRFGPFTLRYTFRNGEAVVGVEHFFAFGLEVKQHFLRAARLRLHLPSKAPLRMQCGLEDGRFFTVPKGVERVSLLEQVPDRFYHGVPYTANRAVGYDLTAWRKGKARSLASGEEADGTVIIEGSRGSLVVALRDFARLHPKEIELRPREGVLDYYLWPERGAQVLDLRRRYEGIRTEGQYDKGDNPQGGRGVGKTHEFLFAFLPGKPEPGQVAALQARAAEPLRVFAPAAHVAQSGVFGPMHPVDTEHFPRWEAMLRLQWEYILRLPGLFHWDGMIDWGDLLLHDYEAVPHRQQKEVPQKAFIVRGYDGWLNNDTNIAREVLTAFVRGGDARLWELWQRLVLHGMDVDTVHSDPSPRRVGAGRRHDQQHWGSLFCGYGAPMVEAGDLYLLTGSLRARAQALRYADWYLRDGGSEWPTRLAAMVRAWEITGDARYRQFLDSPATLEDAQLLKLGTGQISSLDNPTWRTVGTEVGVHLLRQTPGGERWQGHFAEASRLMLANASPAARKWGVRILAYGYLDSGDEKLLAALRDLVQNGPYLPAQGDYFTLHPDLGADPAQLDFEPLAARSRALRKPGPSVRTLIYTYRDLPSIMAALRKAGLDEGAIFTPPDTP